MGLVCFKRRHDQFCKQLMLSVFFSSFCLESELSAHQRDYCNTACQAFVSHPTLQTILKLSTLQRKLNFWLCIHKASCIIIQHFYPVVSRCTTELLHPDLHKLLRGLGLCLIYNKQFQQDQASPWPLLKIFFTPNYLTVTGQTVTFKVFRSL